MSTHCRACRGVPIMRPKVVRKRGRSVVGGKLRYYGRSGWKEREADESDKEQKQRDGQNKRFSSRSVVCCHSLKTDEGMGHCVSTQLEFKGHRSLFTLFSIHNLICGARFALHHLWHPCVGNEKGFKHKATKQHSTGTAAFLPEPQAKIKPFHARYLYSRLSPLGCVKRHFA